MRALNADVLFGQNELTNPTSFINQIDSIEINNGVFQHANIIDSCNPSIDNTVPVEWSNNFMFDCSFESLNGGNIEGVLGGINRLLVKRRPSGQYAKISDGWTTVASLGIGNLEDLQFTIYDYVTANNTIYEYTLVPTLSQRQGGIVMEVESSITDNSVILEVNSEFNGVFICNVQSSQRLQAGVSYDNNTYNQLNGTHQTLGAKYPIMVSNSIIDYVSGGVNGTILNKGYGKVDGVAGEMVGLDRAQIIEAREEFADFITDHKPKILKDWNGNMWLIMLSESPVYSFFNEWGMGLGSIQFSWNEIGDTSSDQDLEQAGMIYETEGGA